MSPDAMIDAGCTLGTSLGADLRAAFDARGLAGQDRLVAWAAALGAMVGTLRADLGTPAAQLVLQRMAPAAQDALAHAEGPCRN
jgi:hypothetical protein